MLRIRPGLEDLKTYSVPDVDWPVRLDANERAEDLPPAVRAKLIARLGALPAHRYPEIAQHSLRAALAAGFGLAADNVAVGNGSSEILAACCHVFGGPGRQIVFPCQPSHRTIDGGQGGKDQKIRRPHRRRHRGRQPAQEHQAGGRPDQPDSRPKPTTQVRFFCIWKVQWNDS